MGKVVETHIVGSRMLGKDRLQLSSTYISDNLLPSNNPGSEFCSMPWKVANLLHWVLQAKLVIAEALGSVA